MEGLIPHLVPTALKLLKQAPLFRPVDPVGDRSQVSLVEAPEGRQKEDLFLKVGSQMEQLHDLGHAGPGNTAETGQFGITPIVPARNNPPCGWRAPAGGARRGMESSVNSQDCGAAFPSLLPCLRRPAGFRTFSQVFEKPRFPLSAVHSPSGPGERP